MPSSPKPWRDGDPRCHCTHCDRCGDLYRTEDIAMHRRLCPTWRELVTLLERAEAGLEAHSIGWPMLPSQRSALLADIRAALSTTKETR